MMLCGLLVQPSLRYRYRFRYRYGYHIIVVVVVVVAVAVAVAAVVIVLVVVCISLYCVPTILLFCLLLCVTSLFMPQFVDEGIRTTCFTSF